MHVMQLPKVVFAKNVTTDRPPQTSIIENRAGPMLPAIWMIFQVIFQLIFTEQCYTAAKLSQYVTSRKEVGVEGGGWENI